MSLKFYFVPHSTSNITAAVLNELESGRSQPLAERVKLSIQAGDTKEANFLATINPNGRVPALVHDGLSIWESGAVTIYLGETFGTDRGNQAASLYPPPGPKRGEAMKWIVGTNINLCVPGARLVASMPPGTPGATEEGSQDLVEQTDWVKEDGKRTKLDLTNAMAVLNSGLGGRDFLLGDTYSLADTHVWTFVSWLTMIGVGLDKFANIKSWSGRVGSRPALQNE